MNHATKQTFIGGIFLSLATGIWGGLYVISKVVLEVIPPFTLLCIRFAMALLLLGSIVVIRGQYVERKDLRAMMGVGFIGITISIGAQFVGTMLSSAHMGAVITSASPAFIVLFAVLILREKLSAYQIAGVVLATFGVLTIVGLPEDTGTSSSWIGNLILLLAALSWGLYTVLCKRLTAIYSSVTVTAYASMFGLLFTSPLMLWELAVTPVAWVKFPWQIWAGVLYIGFISTAGAFYLWNKGFELMSAGSAAVFFFVQPVVGALLGWLLLGEHLSLSFLLGACIIFIGVALSNRSKPVDTAQQKTT